MKSGLIQAFGFAAFFSSYAAARSFIPTQEILSTKLPSGVETNGGALDLSRMNLTVFPIESMSPQEWYKHHEAVKSLLGDQSYVLLRQAEIGVKESEILDYIFGNSFECENYPPTPFTSELPKRLRFISGRVFDVDDETVPYDVITALRKLHEEESKVFETFIMANSKVCDGSRDSGSEPEEVEEEDKGCPVGFWGVLPQKLWVKIPEDYQKYQITRAQEEEDYREMDVMWTKFRKAEERRILAGEYSVRDMALPDPELCMKVPSLTS